MKCDVRATLSRYYDVLFYTQMCFKEHHFPATTTWNKNGIVQKEGKYLNGLNQTHWHDSSHLFISNVSQTLELQSQYQHQLRTALFLPGDRLNFLVTSWKIEISGPSRKLCQSMVPISLDAFLHF